MYVAFEYTYHVYTVIVKGRNIYEYLKEISIESLIFEDCFQQ